MGLFSKKVGATIEEYFTELYDKTLFSLHIGGEDKYSTIYRRFLNTLSEINRSVAEVSQEQFIKEIIALRLELITVAWVDRYRDYNYAIEQSIYTLFYLMRNDRADIWNVMREYNNALQEAATVRRDRKNSSVRKSQEQIKSIVHARFELSDICKKWCNSESSPSRFVKDQQTKLNYEGFIADCVVRVANRIGINTERDNPVVNAALSQTLISRIVDKPTLIDEESQSNVVWLVTSLHQDAISVTKKCKVKGCVAAWIPDIQYKVWE